MPIVIFAFNDDDIFRRNCYRLGAVEFLTVLTSDSEFRAKMLPILNIASIIKQKNTYRKILVNSNILEKNNEVYLDYNRVIDENLLNLKNNPQKAVFGAISPNDNAKFLLSSNDIESIILNNIRKNDILTVFAPNKYFLFLYDINYNQIDKFWGKLSKKLPDGIYAGFCNITNQTKEELINDVLNKLHRAMNYKKNLIVESFEPINKLTNIENSELQNLNFKMFRQEFKDKIKQIVIPTFYYIQQKYSNSILGVNFEHGVGDGYGVFYIKSKTLMSSFRISCPGFSIIHIDITSQNSLNEIDTKRISIEPEDFDKNLLENLLEQFIMEYKRGNQNDS